MRGILAGVGAGVVVSGLGIAAWSYLAAPVVMAPVSESVPEAVPDPAPEESVVPQAEIAVPEDAGTPETETDAPGASEEAPVESMAETEAEPVIPAPEEGPEVASIGPALPEPDAAAPGTEPNTMADTNSALSAPEPAAPPVAAGPPDVTEAEPDTPPVPETVPAGTPLADMTPGTSMDAPGPPGPLVALPGAEENVQPVPDAALPPEPLGEAMPAMPPPQELARPDLPEPGLPEPVPPAAEIAGSDPDPNPDPDADGIEETAGLGIPVPELGAFAPDIPTDNLPRIGALEAEDTGAPEPGVALAPAIERFATPFDPPPGTPILSILLLDPGPGRPDPAALAGFPVPLTIGIDPTLPGAVQAMAAYRAAGHEVAVLAPLPEGAAPADVEVLFQGYLDSVPEAMAVLDVPEARLQENRPRAAQVADFLAETGHGLITYERGLNPGLQVANSTGLPAAAVFRDFDDGTREIPAMKRLLDVGAFRAGQTGAALMVGEVREAAITALAEWVLGNRAATVTLAPVSALLRAGR